MGAACAALCGSWHLRVVKRIDGDAGNAGYEGHQGPLCVAVALVLRNSRQPPQAVMSLASASAYASQTKPCTQLPSANSTLPRPSGAAIDARNEPTSVSGRSQTSIAIDAP